MEFLKKISLALLIWGIMNIPGYTQTTNQSIQAFSKSYEYENLGEYNKAIDELKTVFDEDSYEINLRLGWLLYKSGQFTESEAHYQRAVSLKPYAIQAKLGLIYPVSSQGKWEQVSKLYKEILEIDPNNTTAHYRFGLVYYGKGKYQEAKKHFEKIVNLYPFDYDGLIMLAWTNFRLGSLNTAKVLFNKALLYSPGDASALEGLRLIK